MSILLSLKTLAIKILLIGLAVLGVNQSVLEINKLVPLAGFNFSGGNTYRLKSSISSTASSITLSSFKEPISGIAYTMTQLNTSIGYGTVDPQTTTKEFISFTGITQNSDGSAALTGVTRGLSFSYPYTASSTLQQPHSGQAIFILSDSPQHFSEFGIKRNAESITGIWTFSSTSQPVYDATPAIFTNSLSLVYKGYADALAFQGVATATESTIGAVRLTQNSLVGTNQASSTSGAPLVLTNRDASKIYNAASSTQIVVTGSSNTIDSNFIATSSNYTWTGINSFTGAVTFGSNFKTGSIAVASSSPSTNVNMIVQGGAIIGGATTTVGSFVIASTTLQANGLTYQLPSIQSNGEATTSLLANNGNGGLTWGIPYSSGATSTVLGFVSTQTIAHGLGRVPSMVKITMNTSCDDALANDNFEQSVGTATSTRNSSQNYTFQSVKTSATLAQLAGSGNGSIIHSAVTGGTTCVDAALTNLTSTTFTLTWGTNRNVSGNTTRYLLWEVY